MKLLGNDPFHLIGQRGESIAVDVQSQGTAHLVSYSLDGQRGALPQGQPLNFTLIAPVTLLQLSFDFDGSQSHNAAYRIFVRGSAGGDVSQYILRPSPIQHLTYRFQLTGNGVKGKPRFSGNTDLGGDETKGDYE